MNPRRSEGPPATRPTVRTPNTSSEMRPIEPQGPQPLSRRIKDAWALFRKTYVDLDVKIPPEDITLQKTAAVIDEYVSHPSYGMRGFRVGEITFDITDILIQMGYEPTLWKTGDFMEKHPQVYGIARRRLTEASRMGGIQMEELRESSSHGETIIYHVANLEILRKIASGEIKPPSA